MHSAKLSDGDVLLIRAAKGRESQREVGERFGIDQSTVSLIQQGKRWAHVGARHGVVFNDPEAETAARRKVEAVNG